MSDDNSWTAEVTRRRMLGGVLTVGAASSAAGAGTVALFSDKESSTGNTVQAGTLDLTVGGDSTNTVLNVPAAKPDEESSQTGTLKNDGTLPGYLQFGIQGVESRENGVNEPEADSRREGDSRGGGDDHSGELAQNLLLRMKIVEETDSGTQDHWLVGDKDSYTVAANIRFGARDLDLQLDSDETVEFVTDFEVADAGNEIQSDSVVIDAVFGLAQEADQTIVPTAEEVDATAVGAGSHDEDDDAGVQFSFSNDFGQGMTVTDIHVQPDNTSLSLLSDQRGDNTYQDKDEDEDYAFGADVFIDAPAGDQDGYVDGGGNQFTVPGWIDLASDGWGPNAQQEAHLSADSEATVYLYAFRQGQMLVDMAGKRLRVTLDVRLDDGTETIVPLVMTPTA